MAANVAMDEVWKVVTKPEHRNASVQCPFDYKGAACKEEIKINNHSGHGLKRHFDRHHKNWRSYKRQEVSIIRYAYPAKRTSTYEALSTQQLVLNWFVKCGIPFSNIETPEPQEVVNRCGSSSTGFLRRSFNNLLREKRLQILHMCVVLYYGR